jgi:hypothetical protein
MRTEVDKTEKIWKKGRKKKLICGTDLEISKEGRWEGIYCEYVVKNI